MAAEVEPPIRLNEFEPLACGTDDLGKDGAAAGLDGDRAGAEVVFFLGIDTEELFELKVGPDFLAGLDDDPAGLAALRALPIFLNDELKELEGFDGLDPIELKLAMIFKLLECCKIDNLRYGWRSCRPCI